MLFKTNFPYWPPGTDIARLARRELYAQILVSPTREPRVGGRKRGKGVDQYERRTKMLDLLDLMEDLAAEEAALNRRDQPLAKTAPTEFRSDCGQYLLAIPGPTKKIKAGAPVYAKEKT